MNVVDLLLIEFVMRKSLYGQLRDEINNMQRTRQPLVKGIELLECKVSI
jgi:hypothetical protein